MLPDNMLLQEEETTSQCYKLFLVEDLIDVDVKGSMLSWLTAAGQAEGSDGEQGGQCRGEERRTSWLSSFEEVKEQ